MRRKLFLALGIPSVFIPGLLLAALLGWDYQKGLALLAQRGGIKAITSLYPKNGVVERAVDGDTIELTTGEAIRLIGLQAPERGHPLFRESKEFLEKLVQDKKVALEYEPTDALDKYGRLVAYVYLASPSDYRIPVTTLNEDVLRAGWAKFLFYPHYRKYKYFDRLKEAEVEAKERKVGLWSPLK